MPLVAVAWKDEDEIEGEPFGPAFLEYDDGRMEEHGWVTRTAAVRIAEHHGVPFREG